MWKSSSFSKVRMTGENFRFYCGDWCLIGNPLDGTRWKESCLTTWLCFPTFDSSSSNGVAGSIIFTSLCECLQISCTSYISTSSCDVGGMDGHVSFSSNVALIMLIIFSCSSFSHYSFCAAYSLSRIISCYCCWASSLFANSTSNHFHCGFSCYNNISYSGVWVRSWGPTCTSYAWGSLGNVSSSIISWETSYCNTWSIFSSFYRKPSSSTLGLKVKFFFVRIKTTSLFFSSLIPCCTTCYSIVGCSFYLSDDWKDISTSSWTKKKVQ